MPPRPKPPSRQEERGWNTHGVTGEARDSEPMFNKHRKKKKKGVKKEIRHAILVLLILELSDFSDF